MNKQAYLATLREELKRFPWAVDEAKLDRYVKVVGECLAPGAGSYGFEVTGAASCAAWRAIGGKGKPTFKALRALPGGPA